MKTWLKLWQKVAYPGGQFNLVFPTKDGRVEKYSNIYTHWWAPVCRHLGLVVEGTKAARYSLHDARHFRVSEKITVS